MKKLVVMFTFFPLLSGIALAENDCTKLTCYWRAECYSSSGGFAINDGIFWGCYKSPSEVYSECEKEAKRNTRFSRNCYVVGCDCW